MDIEGEGGVISREKWPKKPLIVTGSRDHSLRVWALPRPGDAEYRCCGVDDTDADPADVSYVLISVYISAHLCIFFTCRRMLTKILTTNFI
jgi:hypothetical protein